MNMKQLFILAGLLLPQGVMSAEFTINVPIDFQLFNPQHDVLSLKCYLYRFEEQNYSEDRVKKVELDESGAFVGVISMEFDEIENPEEITRYGCGVIQQTSPSSPVFGRTFSQKYTLPINDESN